MQCRKWRAEQDLLVMIDRIGLDFECTPTKGGGKDISGKINLKITYIGQGHTIVIRLPRPGGP